MGLLDDALGRMGYRKQQPAVEVKSANADYSGVFNSNAFSTSFVSFNNKKQQLNSYEDWVYIAASLIAEESATIDLRAFKNHSKLKTATIGSKLIYAPKTVQKYMERRKNLIEYDTRRKTYYMRKDVPELEELEDNTLLDLLNSPNPFMTKNEFFEITFLHLELTGNAYWAILERKGKVPTMMFPLLPSQMSIVPDANKFIAGYVYRVNGVDIPFEADDIIHHKYANPNDMREGYSKIEAGARPIDTDAHMAEWNRKTMYNDARISGFITTDETLDEKVFKRVKQEFNDSYGGTANAYKVALLEGGMDFKQLSMTPKDMDFISARHFNRDHILALFGAPKALIGLDESMSRANADAAEYAFSRYRIKPKMERMAARITQDLAPQFDKNLIISFTDPVPENREFDLAEAQAGLGMGGSIPWITPNEERAKRGMPLVPNGDELLIPSGYVPLGQLMKDPAEQEAAAEIQEDDDVNSKKPQDDDSSSDDTSADNDSTDAANSGSGASDSSQNQTGTTQSGDSSSSSSSSSSSASGKTLQAFPKSTLISEAAKRPNPKAKAHEDDHGHDHTVHDDRGTDDTPMLTSAGELDSYLRARQQLATAFEQKFLRGSRDIFLEQKQEVLAFLNSTIQGKAFTELSRKQQKAALGDFFGRIVSAAKWVGMLVPLYKAASEPSVKLAMTVLNNPGSYGYSQQDGSESGKTSNNVTIDPWSQRIKQYFTDRAGTVSKGIDDETDKQLRATLIEGVTAGETRQELMDRVEKIYGAAAGYRAERISRTESQSALNYAAQAAYEESGLIKNYIWLTSINPCPLCLNNEHHVAKSADAFPGGSPPRHPNCACECVPYEFKTGERIGIIEAVDSAA